MLKKANCKRYLLYIHLRWIRFVTTILLTTCVVSCSWCQRFQMDYWVNKLSSKSVEESMHAQSQLIACGLDAIPVIEKALRGSTDVVQVSFLFVVLGNISPNKYADILCEYKFTEKVSYQKVLLYLDFGVIKKIDSIHRQRLLDVYRGRALTESKENADAIQNLLLMLGNGTDM